MTETGLIILISIVLAVIIGIAVLWILMALQ